MSRLYLLRHGALLPNPERRFVGQRDIALSSLGRAQAVFWRKEFAPISFARAICSDLSRCVQSLSIILEGRTLEPETITEFREICLGDWEGLTKKEVEARFPGALEKRGNDFWNYAPQGGESFSMLARRVLPALQSVLEQAAHADNILLVAHAAVNRTIISRWLALSPSCCLELRLACASCTLLDFSAGDLAWLGI